LQTIGLMNPTTRESNSEIEQYVMRNGVVSRKNECHYLDQPRIMTGIHVRPVNSDPGYVVEYVLKTVLRERVSYDEGILILPRAASELALGKSPPLPRAGVGAILRPCSLSVRSGA
jgi:hypothetical protein